MNTGKCLRLVAMLAAVLAWSAAGFEVTLDAPATAAVGEAVRIRVAGDRQFEVNLPEVEGAVWQRGAVGREMRSVNGRVSIALSYVLVPEREGMLEIPPVTAMAGGETARTAPAAIRVVAAAERRLPAAESGGGAESANEGGIPLNTAVFGQIIAPERSVFYAGEEIPLEFKLHLMEGLGIRPLSYPQLGGVENAVFTDYSDRNPDEKWFAPPRQSSKLLDGRRYAVITFATSCRVMKPGWFTPSAAAAVGIPRQSGRSGDDWFGGSMFGFFGSGGLERVRIAFRPELKLEIRPLPPAPSGVPFCGLIGDWRFTAALSSASGRVGEVTELTVTGSGGTGAETVKAPPLELAGCRVYPPEVRKSAGRVELKYAIIPLEPGERSLDFAFAWFDSAAGRYETFRTSLPLAVRPGEAPAVAPPVVGAAVEPAVVERPEKVERSDIFYQKPWEAGRIRLIRLPLIDNVTIWLWVLGCGGPLAGAAWWAVVRRLERRSADPRRGRKARLAALLRELKTAENPDEILRRDAVGLLADAFGLPPGATAEEVSGKLDNPDDRELIYSLENAGFRPGAAGLTPEHRRRLLALLRRLVVLVCALGIALPATAGTPESAGGNAAFDDARYEAAMADYGRGIRPGAVSAAAAYNLGGACYRMDNLPLARLWFERAWRLDPGDDEALANLNVVNRKLRLPESGAAGTPGELLVYCRDRLRPDHYLLIAAAAFALAALLTGMMLSGRPRFRGGWWGVGGLGAVAVLALVCAWSELAGPYNAAHAIVTAPSLELRSLPTTAAGRVEAVIPGGATAVVLDRRGDWLRVETGGREGWAAASGVTAVFPSGGFEARSGS